MAIVRLFIQAFAVVSLMLAVISAFSLELPEPVSWEELQVIQQDSLLTAQELGLAAVCPKSVTTQPVGIFFQNILYITYRWEEHQFFGGKCVVLLDMGDASGISFSRTKKFLTVNQAQVLLSASRAKGFDEKGFVDEAEYYNELLSNIIQDQPLPDEPFFEGVSENSNAEEISYDYANATYRLQEVVNNFTDSGSDSNNRVIGSDNRPTVSGANIVKFPYNSIGSSQTLFDTNNSRESCTGYLVASHVVFTAAHCTYEKSSNRKSIFTRFYPQCRDIAGVNSCFFHRDTTNSLRPNIWVTAPANSDFDVFKDYGAHWLDGPIMRAPYPIVRNVDSTYPVDPSNSGFLQTDLNVVGFPIAVRSNTVFRMYEHSSSLIDDTNNFIEVLLNKSDISNGNSGGPAFITENSFTYLEGTLSDELFDGNGAAILAASVDHGTHNSADIIAYMSYNPNVTFDFGSAPQNFTSYDLLAINNEFSVSVIATRSMGAIVPDLANVVWGSDQDGQFATGGNASIDSIRTGLNVGIHSITASIDDGISLGAKSALIAITGPSGQISAPTFCVVNIRFPNGNTCDIPVSWSTASVPAGLIPVLVNNLSSETVATGRNGSVNVQAGTAATNISLHESADKILTLDDIVVDAKVPTGNLTRSLEFCSLEPSPLAPDGSPRDPKATPPGCDTVLSWNNVTYAQSSSPFIYYKSVGADQWFRLTGLGCSSGAGPCQGSLNTGDLSPELVHAGGVEFKLVQFDNADSGTLSGPVMITGRRFADSYEFDNNYQYANVINIGTVQNLHSFHNPSVYNSSIDVDTYAISITEFSSITRLKAETLNIASGLATGLAISCVGELFITPAGGEPTSEYGNHQFGVNPEVSVQSGVEPGSKVVTWLAQRTSSWIQSGDQHTLLCDQHLITASRVAGNAGEDLTYSIRFSIDDGSSQPDSFEEDDSFLEAAGIPFSPGFIDTGWLMHNFDDDSNDWIAIQSIALVVEPSSSHLANVLEFYVDSSIASTAHPPFCIADIKALITDDTPLVSFPGNCDGDSGDLFPAGRVAASVLLREAFERNLFVVVTAQVRFSGNLQFTDSGTDYRIRAVLKACQQSCQLSWPDD